MTWAVLLSQYPRSILKDERPLLVLSILDRAGLATESELRAMSGAAPEAIRSTLMELQLDQLVEYGTNHVKLTDAGREVLERLLLDTDILEDVLDTLRFEGNERRDYRHMLGLYRKNAFRLYQNSMCTLRQWDALSQDVSLAGAPSARSVEAIAGMRCLLVRDLRNWCSHSAVGSSAASQLNSVRVFIAGDESQSVYATKRLDELHRKTFYYFNCLSTALVFDNAMEVGESVKMRPLFEEFHRFQASSQPDIWFDKWLVEFKAPTRGRFGTVERYLAKLKSSVRALRNTTSTPNVPQVDALWTFFDAWRPHTQDVSVKQSFLADVMVSENIEELSNRTNIPEPALAALLNNVRDACNRLLSESAGTVDVDEQHKRQEPGRTPDQ